MIKETDFSPHLFPIEGNAHGLLYFEYLPCINYSIYHNHTPICLKCTLTNQDKEIWNNIEITVYGSELTTSKVQIDRIAPGQEVTINTISIDPIANRLLELTEGLHSQFRISIAKDAEVFFEKDFPIYIMAFDQWCGTMIRPELLASFVTPNQPLISRVINHAAAHLQQFSGSSAFDEYQTQNPNRVRMQMAALFEALREEAIIYVSSPASFEEYGQRVRLADKVLNEKLGTCLDLSLLYASCLEAVGIHPLLAVLKGHIVVGAWLVDSIYSAAVSDDVSYLLKECSDGINEMVFIESTYLTSSSTLSFDNAADCAHQALMDESKFNLFIDVSRARMDKVRPLPQRVQTNDGWTVENTGSEHQLGTQEVHEYHHYDLKIEEDGSKVTKQVLWERKLLDFTLRNNLLNMRIGKKVIPFISFSIDKIEDFIQAGEQYQILPNPMNKNVVPETNGIYNSMIYRQEMEEFILKDLADKKLHAYLNEAELSDAVKHLYRESRTAMEENGANTLFLVLGVLKWYETPQSERPRFAPLLLLPVEMVRNGGSKKYVLRARDEEIILNITLVELLKQKYELLLPGLSPLPKDESGVDVKKIFSIVRTCILHEKGWDVIEECMLGLFSFSKFVMWNDIHSNADKLKENEIIQGLMENQVPSNDAVSELDIREMDNSALPEDYALPVSADSSQLSAIIEAGEGKSFILHGPPGTGKSQTITNIIANALYHGKKVLFVAEKMAALSVVQNRLERIGLEPFCLELHSNKVNKKHFLEQLDRTLNITRLTSPQEFGKKANALFEQRRKLITYMEKLHQVQACGFSLHDCINRYLSVPGEELEDCQLDLEQLNKEKVNRYLEEIEELETIFQIIGNPVDHPLHGLYPKVYSLEAKNELNRLLPLYKEAVEQLQQANDFILTITGMEIPADLEAVSWTKTLVNALQNLPYLDANIIRRVTDAGQMVSLQQSVELGEGRDRLKAELQDEGADSLLEKDGRTLLNEWREIDQKWCLSKFFASRKFIKQLKYDAPDISEDNIESLLEKLAKYQDLKRQVEEEQLTETFGDLAKNNREDWTAITLILEEAPKLVDVLSKLAERQQGNLLQTIEHLLNQANGQWSLFKQTHAHRLERIDKDVTFFQQMDEELRGWANIEMDNKAPSYPDPEQIQKWFEHLDTLRDWQHWCSRKERLENDGLGTVVDYILTHHVSSKLAAQQLSKSIFHNLASRMIDTDEYLSQFNGMLFEKQIEKYRELAQQFQELTKKELYCKLASKIPSLSMEAVASSEMGILKKNINNGGRGTSIRKMMDQTPVLLPQICPCMLMSPISVAQYIDLDQNKFDLVIFDEASQMPTSEAVGAIARGKSLVVVGDPKQMPPTSFFSSTKVEEEEAYIDDLDSILDDCIALSLPSRYLTWHYRSKHESLIAFSNSQYYDGKLFTFPSTDDRASKVKLIPVEGTYDKGKTRSNRAEAEAIVNEVVRRLSDKDLCQRSIGIVAFSSVQQNLIEDLLTDTLSQNAELEQKAYQGEEPIFVKNLENVQGDERDVILFSIGYGPDKNGNVSMNFGPLNNKGGERRLNVAVSRARYEMLIFSTLKSEQIDLKRTQSLGVEGLKKFLEFAERGTMAIPTGQHSNEDTAGIIDDIAEALRQLGYDVDTQVGRSNFKVDLAIASPENKDEYVLGILCDGKQFKETNTMRDREIVQPSVLKQLHWNILRVWSVDWFENKDAVIKRIQKTMKAIEKTKDVPSAEIAPQPDGHKMKSLKEDLKNAQPVITINSKERPYPTARPNAASSPCSVDEVLANSEKVTLQIQQIVETEQPITNGLIYKRIVQLWKLNRNTPRIQALIDRTLENYYSEDDQHSDNVKTYWKDENASKDYIYYRVNSNRDILDIPLIEICNAMLFAVEQQISIPKEDCKRITSQLLGFSHFGSNLDIATEKALSVLLDKKQLQLQDDKVMIYRP